MLIVTVIPASWVMFGPFLKRCGSIVYDYILFPIWKNILVPIGTCLHKIWVFLAERIFNPCCAILSRALKWFFEEVVSKFCEHLGNFMEFVIEKILIPCIKFLHRWGVFEVLGYFICFKFAFRGQKWTTEFSDSDSGFYQACISLGLFYFMQIYTANLHLRKAHDDFNAEKFLRSLPIFYILLMFPYSVVHQSSMFGYFLYLNLFLRIQMTLDKVMKFRLCDSCLGFSITAFFICLFFIIMKLCGVDDKYLEPFASSVETLNRNILYFGVLSDVALCGYRNTNILGHLIYITILGTGFYYEINYQTKGFRYNSVIYMVLYVFIMSNHTYWKVSKSGTGYIFALACVVCGGCIWCNNHPDLIIKMFQVDQF